MGHERQWLIEKVDPQSQTLGECDGSQPYFNARASRNAPLWREKPNSVSGRAVSQLEAPFSWADASSIALLRVTSSFAFRSAASDFVVERLALWVRFLRLEILMMESSGKAEFFERMRSLKGSEINREEENSLLDGLYRRIRNADSPES